MAKQLPDVGSGGAVPPPRRSRIVLAEITRQDTRAERTRAELAQQTQVGEALVRGLVRAQLALALRLSLVVAIGLGGLPWLFAIAPVARPDHSRSASTCRGCCSAWPPSRS